MIKTVMTTTTTTSMQENSESTRIGLWGETEFDRKRS